MFSPLKYNFRGNQIIYEDPPWRFKNWSMEERAKRGEEWMRRNGRSDYDVMTHQDLMNLKISAFADDDCCRFTWVTFPKLKEGIEYIESEGVFEFKTVAFVWLKTTKNAEDNYYKFLNNVELREEPLDMYNFQVMLKKIFHFGLGYWTHGNIELCLLSTKGHPKREDKSISQLVFEEDNENLVIEPLSHHSKKPDCIRDKIVKLCGDKPRIELFARGQLPPKWKGLGLEHDGQDIRTVLI